VIIHTLWTHPHTHLLLTSTQECRYTVVEKSGEWRLSRGANGAYLRMKFIVLFEMNG